MDTKRKNSRKRTAIIDALLATTEHPTAEMIYNALKPDYPELSLGTVYRNLTVLAQEGMVISVAHVDGQERYDARTGPHAHFVCRGCSRVLNLELPDTVSPLYDEIENELHCAPETHTLNIGGLCDKCREKN